MASLSQTMTGQSIQPTPGLAPAKPKPTGAPGDLTPEQDVIKQRQDQLDASLAKIPNVDIGARMQGLIDQAKSQKVPGRMPPLAAAAAAFGAPSQAANIGQHNTQVEERQRAKDAELLHMQQAILSAQIDQEMQEGKFKKALETSKTMQLLKPITDAAERATAMKEFEEKERIKQAGRISLAKERGSQARSTLVERAKALTKGMSIDERLLLAQVNHIARSQEIALQRAATYDPLAQEWKVNETDMTTIQEDGNTQLEQWIAAHKTTTPAPSSTAPAPAPGGKPQSAQDRIRAAAGR